MKRLLSFLITLGLGTGVAAETAYVTDQFKITARTGESAQHRILSMLSTGTELEVLSRNKSTGYTKVRLPNGREGYVLSRQLLSQPVARERLSTLQNEVDALKAAPGELQQQLNSVTSQYSELQAAHEELQKTNQRIAQELSALQRTSANAVRVSNERNDLRKQVAELTRTGEELKQEKRELENRSAQRWFMIGGGVTVAGILIGLILPHLRIRRRKESWGSL